MTWSIVALDRKTGRFGVAVASRAAASAAPAIFRGVGAVSSQGMFSPAYAPDALQMLSNGLMPDQVIKRLIASDDGHESRQLHLIDAQGRNAGFTGKQCGAWAGHLIGNDVSVAGNLLASPEVAKECLRAYEAASQADMPLEARLLAALAAGAKKGGDRRGTRSAALLLSEGDGAPVDLQIHDHPSPIDQLALELQQGSPHSPSERNSPMDSQYFPPAPQLQANDPFALYRYMGQPQTAVNGRQQARDQIFRQIMGQPAQNAAQGVGQLAAGIGLGLQKYNQAGFPAAPGGGAPSFATTFANIFSGNHNGGLY